MDEIKLAIDNSSRFLRKELTALIETPASNAKEFDMKIIDTYVKGLAMIRNFYFQKPQRMRIVITLAMVIILRLSPSRFISVWPEAIASVILASCSRVH